MPPSTTPNSSDGELPLDIEKQCTHETGRQEIHSKENVTSGGKEEDHEQYEIEPEPEYFDGSTSGPARVLSRVLSRISTQASGNPGPPPDGGKKAWLMCKQKWFLAIL